MSELEQELTACLEPVRAPASVWYRVEAELFPAPSPGRSVLRPALGVVLALLICAAAWSIGNRTTTSPRAKVSSTPVNAAHACLVCHV